jgi:hypothetical protein
MHLTKRFIKNDLFQNYQMNKIKKALGIGALVLALAAGCESKKTEYVTGTVTRERGTVAQVVESNNGFFGKKSIKISDPTYVLQIQTPQGLYTASVYVRQHPFRPLEALALAIEEGSQVRIDKSLLDNEQRFGEDKIGYLYSNEIIVN